MDEWIAILDFGSQYTQLIARRVREADVYCEIVPCTTNASAWAGRPPPKGIILSGGPNSVYEGNAPQVDPALLDLGVPVLGICYGLMTICQVLGAKVTAASRREFGHAEVERVADSPLLSGVPGTFKVWMSHGDRVDSIPEEFAPVARSANSPFAVIAHPSRRIFGVQFHPEVMHTPQGKEILRNFLYAICGCRGEWKIASYVQEEIPRIRAQVGDHGVLLGLSGGVDSTTLAALLSKAIGRRLHCVFVDNGLLRAGEREQVEGYLKEHFNLNLHVIDASEAFLRALRNVSDPEEKRKRIGRLFIEVFEGKSKALEGIEFLAQGTLYPDVIESQSPWGGPSVTIKSHHNVGGLPEKLGFKLLEPFRFLFKDEVRQVARELGLPDRLIWRHPFPGPGLAVRILGPVTPERLDLVRKSDVIVEDEIRRAGLYRDVWQAFAVLLPVQSVGVMGDARTYEYTVAIRAVRSIDGMTADYAPLPHELLGTIASRITNEVRGINRVVYDLSSKPPATIEWE